ncbi:hypothetical protein NIES4102_29300 [Chondrocystis sp. NIES-4102]|nr:hypothetical protein NIES4102_29300 [Chondrocystis sp. NIES-4102]
MIKIVGYFLALCIGLSLGLIGGGGAVLAVPILIYVMGVTPKVAIATSLAVVGIVSVVGIIPHWRQGNVNFKIATFFAPSAMIGAYLGAQITKLAFITETIQLVCFGLVMVITSVLMIRKDAKSSEGQKVVHSNYLGKWLAIPLLGLGIGIITGFVGVGGGFMIVPALVLFGGIAMKQAIGTSLLIIAFNSVTGFIGYLDQVNLNWDLVISFAITASLGTLIGAYLTRFIDAKNLQKGFGYFVLAVAIFVLIKR